MTTASQVATAAVASTTVLISLLYAIGLYFVYRYAQRHPKGLNGASSTRLYHYAPVVYVVIIYLSIIEIAIGTWLLVTYRLIGYYAGVEVHSAICLSIFSGSWSMTFATLYVVFVVHPTLSKSLVASVGVQFLWTLVSWGFWVASVAMLNGSLLFSTPWVCAGVWYCSQLQALFAFAIIELVVFSLCMCALAWLIWQRSRAGLKAPLPR
ncbi:uncharacterized protein LAESUDRAFT_459974 [Laetiporus sulphureus 93-53]|uniref:MARVEL domain-containing protein n=1 Tax=Laetiporus sulphureus 93-53 TaxID=1314785 RepID=A0A165BRT5_9APHY|nr:uncharacterized protein LAESUDRAFT_459974 [Laetiporus sulphureus 93-53]KZT01537.1 hypothetical protein LAESUDRAFT_459974 [Laetiporus sulphureus 93-53]